MADDRAQTPRSFMSVSTFLSFTPNIAPSTAPSTPSSTTSPDPNSLSPRIRNIGMSSPGGLPFDECVSATGGGFLGTGRKPDTCTLRSCNRARTLSNVSCVSNSTWWSAVASVSNEPLDPEEPTENKERSESKPVIKIDAWEDVKERRESVVPPPRSRRNSNASATRSSRRSSRNKENERPPLTRTDSKTPKMVSRQSTSASTASNPKMLSRQSTSASTASTAAANSNRLARGRRPSTSAEVSIISSSTTLNARPSSSGSGVLTPPASSSKSPWPQWSWDSAQGITEARRQKRLEIKQSLTHKYPNDRVHGEFLPFSTGFSHSADSLSPVQFLPPRHTSSSGGDTMVAPATPLEPTTIAWKDLESLRAEYAAADKRKRSAWVWIRQRVLCGAGILGCGGKKEFWEDGDEDRGSIRRYRLELPDRDDAAGAVKVPVRVRSVDVKPSEGGPGSVGRLAPKLLSLDGVEEEKVGQERWSTVGICDGKGIDIALSLPDGFRESEAATPVLDSTVRGVV